MMKSCQNCLENNWSYEFIDGWVRAVCQFCNYEVEFPTRRARKIKNNEPIGSGACGVWEMKEGKFYLNGTETNLFLDQKGLPRFRKSSLETPLGWSLIEGQTFKYLTRPLF